MTTMKFDKLSKTFAHRKMGAFWRCQDEAAKIRLMWTADLIALEADVTNRWGLMSNAALIQNKLRMSKQALEQQVRDLLHLLDNDYQQELLRIAATLGGRVDGKKVHFPDGSEANFPTRLTLKDAQLAELMQ